MAQIELDMRGTKCPLPLLRAQKQMASLQRGDVLILLASDEMAPIDIQDYCARSGHKLLESSRAQGTFTMRIECV